MGVVSIMTENDLRHPVSDKLNVKNKKIGTHRDEGICQSHRVS